MPGLYQLIFDSAEKPHAKVAACGLIGAIALTVGWCTADQPLGPWYQSTTIGGALGCLAACALMVRNKVQSAFVSTCLFFRLLLVIAILSCVALNSILSPPRRK